MSQSPPAPFLADFAPPDVLPHYTESKTRHEARNDAVSLGRIHRLFIQGHTVEHEQLPKGAGKVYVYLQVEA